MLGFYNHFTSHLRGRKTVPVRYSRVRTTASEFFLATLHLDPVKELLNFFFQYENNFKN